MSTVAEAAAETQTYSTWTAILGFVGANHPSSDGRVLDPAGMTVRPLPLTLLFMPATDDGHDGSYPVGAILQVWVDGDRLMGSGTWDASAQAQEAARMVADEVQREISIDPVVQKYSMRMPVDYEETIVETDDGNQAIEITESVDDYLMTYVEWELAGATIVTGAAFSGTEITVTADGSGLRVPAYFKGAHIIHGTNGVIAAADVDESEETGAAVAMIAFYPTPEEATALAESAGVSAEELHLTLSVFTDAAPPDAAGIDALLTEFAGVQAPLSGDVTGVAVFAEGPDGVPIVALADVYGLNDLRADLCEALDAAGYPYATDHDFVPHLTLAYGDSTSAAMPGDPAIGATLTFGAVTFSIKDGERTDYQLTGAWEEDDAAEGVTAAAAGLAPLEPPAEWFDTPSFDGPTPLTITPEGRIYGHFAPFGVCHTGRQGQCLDARQLRSRTAYSYFNTGYIRCADGSEVACGVLTMDTGHPAISMSASSAIAHYDNTGSCVADVRAGEDSYGQWIVGALRPDVPAEKVRALRSSPPSGDWRPINGHNELIGVLAVNVQGYPLPRPEVEYAVAASGNVELIAATAVAAGRMPDPLVSDDVRLAVMRASLDGLDGLRALLPA